MSGENICWKIQIFLIFVETFKFLCPVKSSRVLWSVLKSVENVERMQIFETVYSYREFNY